MLFIRWALERRALNKCLCRLWNSVELPGYQVKNASNNNRVVREQGFVQRWRRLILSLITDVIISTTGGGHTNKGILISCFRELGRQNYFSYNIPFSFTQAKVSGSSVSYFIVRNLICCRKTAAIVWFCTEHRDIEWYTICVLRGGGGEVWFECEIQSNSSGVKSRKALCSRWCRLTLPLTWRYKHGRGGTQAMP